MRFTGLALFAALFLLSVPIIFAETFSQNADVYVEAYGTANLRSGPSTDFAVVYEIAVGTEYRVLKQHALVPWLLLEVPGIPTGAGWVFSDLVQLKRGSLSTVPYESEFFELPLLAPGPTAVVTLTSSPENLPTATLTPAAEVTARLLGRSNMRYGPGIDYPVLITLDGGTSLPVLARHSTFPWYKVATPNGEGWVFADNVEIQGNIYTVEVISSLAIPYPTPTATPDTVVVSASPLGDFGSTETTLANTLGLQIDQYLLSQGLAPRTDREASVFVMDLQTGEHFTLNGGVAYSGTSINKISILVGYFLHKNDPIKEEDAMLMANTMICSENITTNQMLASIGDGDVGVGGERVSQMMQDLGLGNTFVRSSFDTGIPDPTPVPFAMPITQADQTRTQPDPYNQITVEEIGWLLGGMYQCAADGTGPLIDRFGTQLNQQECQQMLRVMRANKIGALIEAGVGAEALIAHKHGWVNNTHGDAGIVFGPEKNYVIAMIYHERTSWLNYEQSFPVLEEISRTVWNYFNPSAAIPSTTPKDVPETCNIFAEPVIPDLLGGDITLPIPQPQNQPTGEPPKFG